MKLLDPNRAVLLQNATCPYCGSELAPETSDRDHVIGRRFVPKGTLDSSWNLIVRCCISCNRIKSDLEDDISAVTMQADAFGTFAQDDEQLRAESVRKGRNSISRRTGKPVMESWESRAIEHQLMPGVTMTFSFVAPPQLHRERVASLAGLHLSAFFYWITYDHTARRGGFCPGEGAIANVALRADWGNKLQTSFAAHVRAWERRVHAVAAQGFFKIAVRRHPTLTCWSWALEWNQNARVVGFIGDPAAVESSLEQLSPPESSAARHADGSTSVTREEVPLTEADDIMFEFSSHAV